MQTFITAALVGAATGAAGATLGYVLAKVLKAKKPQNWVGACAAIAAAVGQAFVPSGQTDESFRRDYLVELRKHELTRHLEQEFPERFATMVDKVVQHRRDWTKTQIASQGGEFTRNLRIEFAPMVRRASEQSILTLFQTKYDTLVALSQDQDKSLCNTYILGIPAREHEKIAGYLEPVQREAMAVFKAIADGRAGNMVTDQPDEEDWDAVRTHWLSNGGTESLLNSLATPTADDESLCEAQISWLAALLSVQGETAHRVRTEIAYEIVSTP